MASKNKVERLVQAVVQENLRWFKKRFKNKEKRNNWWKNETVFSVEDEYKS